MKMPSGGNHYTQWILELRGLEYSKMQRNDCYQTLQSSEKKSACATGLLLLELDNYCVMSKRIFTIDDATFICVPLFKMAPMKTLLIPYLM